MAENSQPCISIYARHFATRQPQKDSIPHVQQWLRDDGTLDQTVPWEQLVDTRLIDQAVKELGPYQP